MHTDTETTHPQEHPNVLFILIDDMGWRDLTCTGSSFYETPNIDRLCREGMRFTDAYAACPVCSPTRASILTGKYPARVGVTDWINWGGGLHPCRGRVIDAPYTNHLPLGETSLATCLREHGYQTWHVGKWHLGADTGPETHGFDVNIGGCEAGSPARGGYFSPWSIPALANVDVPDETYLTDFLGDRAVDLIRERKPGPFFLNLWFYSVHTPIQAKPEKIAKYKAKARRLGLNTIPTFEDGGPFPTDHKKKGRIKRRLVQSDPVYAAMIESLDENIGRILETLDSEGLADDTLVIFTSDNGGLATAEGSPTCNAPLSEGKGWMYEGGTREPLLVRWPNRIAGGTVCRDVVTSPDFYPTILESAGLPLRPQQHCDGVSILPLLEGAEKLNRGPVFWHYPHYGNQGGTPGASVREGSLKLIEFFEDGRYELYDLDKDPGEGHNICTARPEEVERLAGILDTWKQSVNARIPRPNPDYAEGVGDTGVVGSR